MALLSVSLAALAAAEPESAAEKTLAPYFLLPGAESSVDQMPLKSTAVEVKIAGVIADVRISQVYANAGGTPLEAIYIFPGSTRAAVYGLEMRIGERVVKAEVQKREQARQTYEAAKTEGKSTSLLEQHRPNVFQMNVANILPGDTIQVELRYTEFLVPTAGEYEFVFPTVVGPRYSNTPATGAPETAEWVANPYLTKGVPSPAAFQIGVEVIAGMPLQGFQCTSHAVKPEFQDASHATVRLDAAQTPANDRDFILKYRLAEAKIESGLMISEGEKENFFMLTVQPPKRITPAELPPREYIFVVDVSGSMNGFPLEISKGLIKQLLATLRPTDSFNILLFSGGNTLLAPSSQPATAENLAAAVQVIDHQRGGGGTELLPALRQTLALPNRTESARSIVVITDGFVDVEPEAFTLIRENLNKANLFAFGIGSSVNRHLIEGMAHAGQGEPFIVTRPNEAEAEAKRFREYISAPVLTHVHAEFGAFQAYDGEPASIPDLLAERPVVLLGKWKGAAEGAITVRGRSGAGEYVQTFDVAKATRVNSTEALGYLWARKRIATLADFNALRPDDERTREVTNLGLTYHLLTAYTSFVAVDEEVRNKGGGMSPVKQPLPLPAGVENSAISGGGAPISTTPEPSTWLLLLVAAAILGFSRNRGRACA